MFVDVFPGVPLLHLLVLVFALGVWVGLLERGAREHRLEAAPPPKRESARRRWPC